MSTNQGFAAVSAPPKPYLICSGKVTNISEAKLTAGATETEPEKIQWVRQSFRVEGIGASESAFYSFMYRPEWFAPGFAQDQIGGTPKQVKAQQFIYRRNIFNKDAAAFLLAPSPSIRNFTVPGSAFSARFCFEATFFSVSSKNSSKS